MFEQKFDLDTMLLHAQELTFQHPFSQQMVTIKAPINAEFSRILSAIGMNTEGL
jgi:tRNA pseudouridine65 synthase